MTQEKMINVAIARLDAQKKMEWLHIWNGDQAIKNHKFLPLGPNMLANPSILG
jgi:hypothetical protein